MTAPGTGPRDEPVQDARGLESRLVASATLFQGNREIVILHRGQEYRLRITKADKLILTK